MSEYSARSGSSRKSAGSRSSTRGPAPLAERVVKIALALTVVIAGVRLLRTGAPEAQQGVNPSPPSSLAELEKALRDNPASAYRWIEAAEGYDQAGDSTKALFCLHRAEQLGPNLPPVWIRASAFYFRTGESGQALRMGAKAQAISGEADAFLFQYYDRFVRSTPKVLNALADNPRASVAYFRHLLPKGSPEDAGLAWAQVEKYELADSRLREEYVNFLLDRRRFESAQTVWAAAGRDRPPSGYPVSNRVYNGGFEQDFSGSRLDWKAAPANAVEMERDTSVVKAGKSSFRVTFPGTENLEFDNPAQTAVASPGHYLFTAWLKTEVITTDEGVRFCIADAENPRNLSLQSESTRGTTDWTELRMAVSVPPATHLLKVSLCRHASLKFDSKIAGKAWIDDVSLRPSN